MKKSETEEREHILHVELFFVTPLSTSQPNHLHSDLLKKKSPSKCILPMKEIYSPIRSCDFPLQVFELNTRALVDQEGPANVLPLKKKRKDSSYVFSVLDIFAFIPNSHASPQSPPPPSPHCTIGTN